MQHKVTPEWTPVGRGIGRAQIGQMSHSGLSCPWLYSLSSSNSAARCLHAFLCCLRWAFWQSTPQYLTRRHAAQFFSLTVSLPSLPQLAHAGLPALPAGTGATMAGTRVQLIAGGAERWRTLEGPTTCTESSVLCVLLRRDEARSE